MASISLIYNRMDVVFDTEFYLESTNAIGLAPGPLVPEQDLVKLCLT